MRRLVRDLELEAKGRCQRRDREERAERLASVGGRYGEGSHQSSSHQHRDRSREYANRDSISPEGQRPSGHIISLFSPTFSHNFSNIIADIHLSPHVVIHISQINGNICYIA